MAFELLNLVETYVDICIPEGQGVSTFSSLKRNVPIYDSLDRDYQFRRQTTPNDGERWKSHSLEIHSSLNFLNNI